ncbi:winged helix-turn-helix transcriptional regulator [Nocardia bhagyanarayanae]|uniref:HxlR family transcriptional regulator n=1 Tax=Nocardia bhagyanarayanae TaxID=1215925 RepID=A0A543F6A7_9NOCA|nr:helix-turn-helix domain-containing protein [Nocardia bhagyanarayanae]TQM29367.1 HxlR family transcriptional regulator [Nocardia bhagyanarayanae]
MSDYQDHCGELVADCRLRAVTDLFAHTWDPVVLAALHGAPRRRSELRAAIGGISDKALTEALHRLLGHGLIERHRFAQAPPRVEYGLTTLGASLVDGPMQAMAEWIRHHGDALLAAQELPEKAPQRSPGSSASSVTSSHGIAG